MPGPPATGRSKHGCTGSARDNGDRDRLGASYADYESDIAWLHSPWGIENRADHRRTPDGLMATRFIGRTHESVLRIRRTPADRAERTPSRQEWSDSITRTLNRRGTSATDPAEADESLRRIVRYSPWRNIPGR